MNTMQLNVTTEKLTKSYTYEKKKIYEILKKLTPEEIEAIFYNDNVFNNILKINDYDFLFMIFRMVPASVQEKIWSYPKLQKLLLGLGSYSDDVLLEKAMANKFFYDKHLEKKDKRGEFYFSKEKVRNVELFLRSIKSEKILNDLVNNKYYQLIIFCSKKLPKAVLQRINIEELFNRTIDSDLYPVVSDKTKRSWCFFLNNNCEKLLIPPDVSKLFTETKKGYSYSDMSIGRILSSKLWSLGAEGRKLVITKEQIASLNTIEVSILLDCKNGVVNQEQLDEHLNEILAQVIRDGSIVSPQYIPLENLGMTYPFRVFKIACYKLIGSPFENKLLDYIYKALFHNEYSEDIKTKIYASLRSTLIHIDQKQVQALFMEPDDIKTIFFLRFNIISRRMDYLHGISLEQLMNINVKHVNRIARLLDDNTQDELSDKYSKAIKMYFAFGLEKSLKLLNGEYGPITKVFTDNVSKLDVSKTEMREEGSKSLPVPNEEFNHFLFSDSNNIVRLFKEGSAIQSSWSYLYNNIDKILDVCKGHITALQAETILSEQVNNVKYDLTPDNYRLRSILYEVGLGNKTKNTNEKIYDELVKTYEKQKKRVSSSIPYVSGKLENGYRYETMKLDSLVGYTLGYKAGCCIRLLDIAHNHLLHALLCENGRILIVYNPDGSIASFSPLKRNGEVLIANSIEAVDKNMPREITEAFSAGIKDIMQKSKDNEDKDYLKVACIGANAYMKPNGVPWPSSIPTPTILEKDDPVYRNTDEYHRSLLIIQKDEKADLRKLKSGPTEIKYYDPREKYVGCSFKDEDALDQLEAIRAINAIRYEKYKESKQEIPFYEVRAYYLKYVFYAKDWYVLIDIQNRVQYEALDNDPRAVNEMTAALTTIQEHMNKNDVDNLLLKKKNDK